MVSQEYNMFVKKNPKLVSVRHPQAGYTTTHKPYRNEEKYEKL